MCNTFGQTIIIKICIEKFNSLLTYAYHLPLIINIIKIQL